MYVHFCRETWSGPRLSTAAAVTALHMHAQSHFQGQLAKEAESDPVRGERSNVNIKETGEIQPPCERTTDATDGRWRRVALNREGADTAIKVTRLSPYSESGRAG